MDAARNSNAYFGNMGDFTFAEWPIKLVVLLGAVGTGARFFVHFVEDVRTAATESGRSGLLHLASVVVAVAIVVGARYALAAESSIVVGLTRLRGRPNPGGQRAWLRPIGRAPHVPFPDVD